MRSVYLDNNSTTMLAPEVKEAMLKYFDLEFGNPSSLHQKGVEAERGLKESRRTLSLLLGVKEDEVYFTSGATEADNLAIKGIARANKRKGMHVITSPLEHEAVLESCKELEDEGFGISYVKPDEFGRINPKDVAELIRADTVLVALMHVNNELGTVYDIKAIAKSIRSIDPEIIIFSDGVQAFGKLNMYLEDIDAYSISAHKIHGPKGIGALYLKEGVKCKPLIAGGGQESGLRSGTENVPGAVGLAKAAQIAYENINENMERMSRLRSKLIDGISEIPDTRINSPMNGLHSTVNAAFLDTPAEVLLHSLEENGIYVSSGSACSSNTSEKSHVLKSLPAPEWIKDCSLRFGLSRHTTEDEIDHVIESLNKAVDKIRKVTKR